MNFTIIPFIINRGESIIKEDLFICVISIILFTSNFICHYKFNNIFIIVKKEGKKELKFYFTLLSHLLLIYNLQYEFSGVWIWSNSFGEIIFAKISIPAIVLGPGLLKYAPAFTTYNSLFLIAFKLFHSSFWFNVGLFCIHLSFYLWWIHMAWELLYQDQIFLFNLVKFFVIVLSICLDHLYLLQSLPFLEPNDLL